MIYKETKATVEFKIPTISGTYKFRLYKRMHVHEIRILRKFNNPYCSISEVGEQLLRYSGMQNKEGIYSGVDYLNHLGVKKI